MKCSVTPELAILLKTMRAQNGISAKDLAKAIGKSPSYLSKLEAGTVKSIQKDLLTNIITFISDGDDFFEDCLPNAIKVLQSFMDPKRATSQAWLLQYDLVDRPITIPSAMVDDMNRRIAELPTDLAGVIAFTNANVDSEMSSSFAENMVLSLPYEEGDRLLVRVRLNEEDVTELFAKKRDVTNYLTIHSLVFTLMRMMEFGGETTKLPPDKAKVVLQDISAYMGQYNIHSLTGFSHMLSSEEFFDRQRPLAWPFEQTEDSALNEAVTFFREAMDHDALNTKKALDSFLELLNWDPAFAMKLISLPFHELEGLSFQNKKNLLEDLSAVVEKYNSMSDFEKRMETY